MDNNENNFVLNFEKGEISVQKHSVGVQTIFKVNFSDNRKPLIVTRALHANAYRFWTSIPEGRQREAEEVGTVISEYFKTIE